MAKFNPAVPDMQDPNYLGYSKVVDAAPPDQSTAIALKTAAAGITDVATVADDWIKKDIDKEVYTGVDTERNAYTTALETAKSTLIPGQQQPSLVPQAADGTTAASVPTNLQSSLQQIDTLGAARDGGKINDTYYTQRLTTLAQNVRNEYPGYRDYIDQKISNVTGMNPANAYYKNLMQDINSQVTKQKSVSDQLTQQLINANDLPDQWMYLKARNAGQLTDDQVSQFLNTGYALKTKYNNWDMQRKIDDSNKADKADLATKQFTTELGTTLFNRFNNVQSIPIPGMDNGATISKLLSDNANNKIQISDTQQQGILQVLSAAREAAKTEAFNMSNARGYAATIGTETRDKIMNSQLQQYDSIIKSITDKDYGSAYVNLRKTEARLADTGEKLTGETNGVGQAALLGGTFQKLFGPSWSSVVDQQFLKNGVRGKVGTYLNDELKNAQIAPDLRQAGASQSLYDTVKTLQDGGVSAQSKAYDGVINGITMTINNTQAPDEAKINAAHHTFNPKNFNTLDLFQKDYYDPDKRQTIPGKYSVYNKLTSAENTESIYKLGKQDPTLWPEYRNWADTSFKKLFQQDVLDFNGQNSSNDPMNNYNPQRGVTHVAFNSTTHQFNLVDEKMNPIPLDYKNAGQTGITLGRMNLGLSNLSRVYAKDGGDVNGALLNYLKEIGGKLDNVQGLPQQIRAAIETSQMAGQFSARGR